MAQAPRKEVHLSPFGVGRYVHLNKPDVFVNPKTGASSAPRFKTQLVLSGADRDAFKGQIDKWTDDAFVELTKDLPAKKVKALRKAYPYDDVIDAEGAETGEIAFKFAMNAVIKTKEGEVIDRKPLIVDSKRRPTDVAVWSGSEFRVAFTMRPYINDAAQTVGVTLDMLKVQIKKLVQSSGIDRTFGDVEDGWSQEHEVENGDSVGGTDADETAEY